MQHSQDPRIDLVELKLHIVKKIGVERSKRYFYYLGRFLSQKVTKSEFDKSCYRLLGRENLPLHNKLIRSILNNTFLARSSDQNKNDHVYSNGKAESLLNGDLGGSFAYQRLGRFDKGQVAASVSLMSPIVAPLGISRTCRTVPVSTRADSISCYANCELLDKKMLRKRMENIAIAQGLEGASMECCSMLNNMVDVYMKKLIKSCVGLVGTQEQQPVSLLDFRVAMELNPQQLSEDWRLLRERILMRAFEEGREGV